MKVITVTPSQMPELCRRLEQAVGTPPALVVGIARGGVAIANGMFQDVPHVEVSARRPGTGRRRRNTWISALLRRLPLPIRNVLRNVEARALALRPAKANKVYVGGHAAALIAQAPGILIVDDAVDSGATLAGAIDAVNALKPQNAVLTTAAVVVTTHKPLIKPDVTLHSGVLVRFPWAIDA